MVEAISASGRSHQANTTEIDTGESVDSSAQNASGDQRPDHWDRLDAFLETDPQDAGCDAAMELLDVYAELIADGSNPAKRFPGLHAHFLGCGPCAQALEGLLAALTGETSSRPDPL